MSPAAGAALLVIFLVVAVVGLIVGLVLLYFGSRMQLVLMDLVATRTTMVAPAWHRTASRTWRWIGLKIAAFFVTMALLGVALAIPLIRLFRRMSSENTAPNAAFFENFAFIFVSIFFAVLTMMIVIWFLRDLVLPYILFSDARLGDALRGAFALVRREPGEVAFYFLMKFLLTIAVGIAGELCIVLAVIAIGLPTGGISAALWFLLHKSGSFATVMMYTGFVILGLIFLTVLLGTIVCIAGAVLIFYQSYALYFVGGRYPALGDLLEPPPPPMPHQEPVFNPS